MAGRTDRPHKWRIVHLAKGKEPSAQSKLPIALALTQPANFVRLLCIARSLTVADRVALYATAVKTQACILCNYFWKAAPRSVRIRCLSSSEERLRENCTSHSSSGCRNSALRSDNSNSLTRASRYLSCGVVPENQRLTNPLSAPVSRAIPACVIGFRRAYSGMKCLREARSLPLGESVAAICNGRHLG